MSFDTGRFRRRSSSSGRIVAPALIALAALTVLLLWTQPDVVTASADTRPARLLTPGNVLQPPATAQAIASEEEARARCGTACHKFPPPELLPRTAWRAELISMMLIQEGIPEPAGAAAVIPLPPDWLRLLRYYESRAPEALPAPDPWPPVQTALPFRTHTLVPHKERSEPPAIASVRFLDLDRDGAPELLASDMRDGRIVAAKPAADLTLTTIATLRHPAHIDMVDLDKDGRQDLLVADLGSFPPGDHQDGAVYWLQRQRDGRFTTIALAKGLARTADARAADFDRDGDLDVILAVFGWRRTGSVILLENQTRDWTAPRFIAKALDARTGAIHVPVGDLQQDRRPDFVALLAQEHESVVAFLATSRTLEFKPETIYAAPHPNWGSSGIELVDLDKDGDLDVLLTHGDTFDDFRVKPYDGIMWLENRGTYPFTPRALATLPGAHRALATDLDLDGDLDIVATAMVAGGGGEFEPTLASVVWLEQTRRGVFERRTLEMGRPYHATMDVADYDGDGDPDLAVGWFAPDKPIKVWLEIWENLAKSRAGQ
jgi:FG-GAP-like repeat